MRTAPVLPRWRGKTVVVAAPGPSLAVPGTAELTRPFPTIAIQDAWRLVPWADVLYGCDEEWWRHHKGCPDFQGEAWSCHQDGTTDKRAVARAYGVRLVGGNVGKGFSLDPMLVHYGNNSGFQAVNLAVLFGASRIVLVGFDMRDVGGQRHFFGSHPKGLRQGGNFKTFIRPFVDAADSLPAGLSIVNATPGSSLRCFPIVPPAEALDAG